MPDGWAGETKERKAARNGQVRRETAREVTGRKIRRRETENKENLGEAGGNMGGPEIRDLRAVSGGRGFDEVKEVSDIYEKERKKPR